MERTFVMLKPGSIQRGLIGHIISRFENRGLKITAMKMLQVTTELAERHYAEHKEKPFYESLVGYITSGPVVAMVLEGPQAISVVRKMMGATDPLESSPGTIRGDLGLFTGKNIVHGSDSEASAKREIGLFFSDEDFVSYKKCDEEWILE
ncbi:MAG: nucleoside-diphosphate kinase [Methanomassiliicoccales archaeon]|nr:MAG: nucleoside-diphosphate kinase [Methanomassiliicoccales archaeon]